MQMRGAAGGEGILLVSEATVTTIPTDTAIAAEIRAELRPILEQAAVVMNKARARGLIVNFAIGLDAYGRHAVNSIDVVRPL